MPALFTKANAAEYSRKGTAARVRNAAITKATIAAAQSLLLKPFAVGHSTARPDEGYVSGRLAGVRAQLAKLDAMLLEAKDPRDIDRLASASDKLSKQEFALAGRPMPGQRRPREEPEPTPPPAMPWLAEPVMDVSSVSVTQPSVTPEPAKVADQVTPACACGPDTPTGSVS